MSGNVGKTHARRAAAAMPPIRYLFRLLVGLLAGLSVGLLAAVLIGLLSGCSAVRTTQRGFGAQRAPDIRVLLGEAMTEVEIESKSPFQATARTGMRLLQSRSGGRLHVTARYPSLFFRILPEEKVATIDGEVLLTPEEGSELSFGGVSYPGRIKIVSTPSGLSVVNVLSLERYLEGVLPHEIGNPGPHAFAVLEAQAVASRSYALARIEERRNQPFDVYAGVQDQIYRGSEGASELLTSAVRETRGEVLDYNGERVRAYYCASCGGHTSDIRRIWPEREWAPYLTGIRDVDGLSQKTFCSEGRHFRWRYSFSGREMGEILRETLPRERGIGKEEVGTLHDIRILERSVSGRVKAIEIETSKGVFRIQGDRIRWVLMPDPGGGKILPSTMFNISKSMEADRVSFITIIGGGNGHGVGMCQSGAIAMAKRGYTCEMILTHYYPGCRVIRIY